MGCDHGNSKPTSSRRTAANGRNTRASDGGDIVNVIDADGDTPSGADGERTGNTEDETTSEAGDGDDSSDADDEGASSGSGASESEDSLSPGHLVLKNTVRLDVPSARKTVD